MKLVDVDNLGIAKADIEILGDASYVYGWNSALQVVTETNHTIDPETLPIVQTLKRQVQEAESEAQPEFQAFSSSPFGSNRLQKSFAFIFGASHPFSGLPHAPQSSQCSQSPHLPTGGAGRVFHL